MRRSCPLLTASAVALMAAGCARGGSEWESPSSTESDAAIDAGQRRGDGGTGTADGGLDATAPAPEPSPDTGLPDASADAPADAPDASMAACPEGTGDCDGDPSNGCETDLTADPNHCGECDNACEALPDGPRCERSRCVRRMTLTGGQLVDTYVDDSLPDASFSTASRLLVDASPDRYETLLKPADPTSLPADATVLSSTLELTCFNEGDLAYAHRVREPWGETVTYATRPARQDDAFATYDTPTGTLAIDMTEVVQAWVDGDSAHGVLLRSPGTNGSDYRSSEYSDSAKRPRLIIEYR